MTSGAGERTMNGRRRRLKLRRARCSAGNIRCNRKKAVADEKPTEVWLHFCSSSSSERSPDNDGSAVLRGDSLRESLNQDVPATLTRTVVSSCGCVSLIGRRREMEDAVRMELGFASRARFGDRYDFFGVYDGHGGAHVAGECKELLHRIVKGRVEAAEGHVVDWGEVMGRSFADMDAVVRNGDEGAGTVGSTAVVAVVGSEVVVIANCGDSRAIMFRGGTAIALSEDHKVLLYIYILAPRRFT